MIEDAEELELMAIPDEFMQEMNQTIKDHSNKTAVTFLRLPIPPKQEKEMHRLYNLLTIQSEGLAPVMYVHGLKTVVSSSV